MTYSDRPTLSATRGESKTLTRLWLVISLAVAAWLVWSSRDDIELLTGASLSFVAAMVTVHAVSLVTQSERFRIVLQQQSGTRFSVKAWMRIFVRGRLFSSLIPQSGHLYRGWALRQDHQTPVLRYVSTVATQTWLGVVASLGIAALLTGLGSLVDTASQSTATSLVLLSSAIVLACAPLLITHSTRLMPRRLRRSRLAAMAAEVLDLAGSTVRDGGLLATFLAYSFVGFVSAAVGLRIALEIVGQEVTWVAAVAILAFIHLGNLVSITPGNLGIQEVGLGALAALFGYAPGAGVLASVVVRISNVVVLSAMAMMLEGAEMRSTRRRWRDDSS